LTIDAAARGEGYQPIWKKLVTSGRAAEGVREHGRVYDAWMGNGSPRTPTAEHLELIRTTSSPEGRLSVLQYGARFQRRITLQPLDVVLFELERQL